MQETAFFSHFSSSWLALHYRSLIFSMAGQPLELDYQVGSGKSRSGCQLAVCLALVQHLIYPSHHMLSFREGSHNDAGLLAGLSASEDMSDLVTGKRKRKMIDYKVGHAPCETDTACTTSCYGTLAFVFPETSTAVPSTSARGLYSFTCLH